MIMKITLRAEGVLMYQAQFLVFMLYFLFLAVWAGSGSCLCCNLSSTDKSLVILFSSSYLNLAEFKERN